MLDKEKSRRLLGLAKTGQWTCLGFSLGTWSAPDGTSRTQPSPWEVFGDTYDLHGGASELMFPHHEAEIAQAEALTGKSPFVRCWLHTGLLTVEGRKMSKSLGNVVRIHDALKEYSAQELRWYFATFPLQRTSNYDRLGFEEG